MGKVKERMRSFTIRPCCDGYMGRIVLIQHLLTNTASDQVSETKFTLVLV